MFKAFLRRNDIGVGSVFSFVIVPLVAAAMAVLDKVDVWSLTPDQMWGLAKAAFASFLVGALGRFGQSVALKWGAYRIPPRADDIVKPGESFEVSAPEGLV